LEPRCAIDEKQTVGDVVFLGEFPQELFCHTVVRDLLPLAVRSFRVSARETSNILGQVGK
jgi:hypothetical protein